MNYTAHPGGSRVNSTSVFLSAQLLIHNIASVGALQFDGGADVRDIDFH